MNTMELEPLSLVIYGQGVGNMIEINSVFIIETKEAFLGSGGYSSEVSLVYDSEGYEGKDLKWLIPEGFKDILFEPTNLGAKVFDSKKKWYQY